MFLWKGGGATKRQCLPSGLCLAHTIMQLVLNVPFKYRLPSLSFFSFVFIYFNSSCSFVCSISKERTPMAELWHPVKLKLVRFLRKLGGIQQCYLWQLLCSIHGTPQTCAIAFVLQTEHITSPFSKWEGRGKGGKSFNIKSGLFILKTKLVVFGE